MMTVRFGGVMVNTFRVCVLFALLLLPDTALAQFVPETETREIHILKAEEGDTKIILRFPLILAYANELANHQAGTELTAPFIINAQTDGQQVFQLDSQALLDDYGALSKFLLRDYRFTVNDTVVVPDMPEYVVVDGHDLADLDVNIGLGLTSSSSMLTLCVADYPDNPDIAETLIVISFYLTGVMPDDTIKMELLAEPFTPPEGAEYQTIITDYRAGVVDRMTVKGVVFGPVILGGGKAGIQDILRQYGLVIFLVLIGSGLLIYRRFLR
jgi:hypothetical protein